MPKIRRDAVVFANKQGVRKAARYYGFSPGAICAWKKKAKKIGLHPIPTKSSRPRHHPKELSTEVVRAIVKKRIEIKRSAEVVHKELEHEGVNTSLSSVKRTLDRRLLLNKRSPWKRRHLSPPRPHTQKPGDLVQMDTIHLMVNEKERIYVFTGLDVHSRWAYARAYERVTARDGVFFARLAQAHAPFMFSMIQSDHGPEWSTHFTERIKVSHRHSRVRRPNDNAHLERFNRTIQDELLDHLPRDVKTINKHLPQYLKYYNEKRLHFGISLRAPEELLTKCSQAID